MPIPRFNDASRTTDAKADTGRDPAARAAADPFADPFADPGDSPPAQESGGIQPPLIVIAGPTASGKSSLAIYLAERLNGEIINYDSVQVYRGLDIGSGKVARELRRKIPHHLFDVVDPGEPCTAGRFRRMALDALADLRRRRKLPILAGGTGLYLRALLKGLFEGPERSTRLRARLQRIEFQRGRPFLHKMLLRYDADAASRIHANDSQKVIRALEIRLLSGEPASRLYQRGREGLEGFSIVKIGLNPPRQELMRRINLRVERMFASGLVEETRAVLTRLGLQEENPLPTALLALGYRHACMVLRNRMGVDVAVRLTQAATRQYAKRQMTWFRRETEVRWFEGFGEDPAVQQGVMAWLQRDSGISAAQGSVPIEDYKL